MKFSAKCGSLGLVLTMLVANHPSVAESARTFNVPQWTGRTLINAKTKQFEVCSASSKNEAGIVVTYSVDRRFNWKLSLSSPGWDFIVGHRLRVIVRTGDEEFRDLAAIATTANSLEIEVIDAIPFFERLRNNRSMRVQAGGLNWDFPNLESGEVMASLVGCVLQQMPRAARAKTSTAASNKPLNLGPAADPRSESNAIAAGVLAQIGVTGVQFVSPGNTFPIGRADAAWRKDTLTGTVAVMADRPWNPETITSEILTGSAQPCRGQLFVIAAPATIDRTSITRSYISCRDISDVVSAYYLAVPRAAGGYYQIATIKSGVEFGPRRMAEDLDLRIRDVVIGVIAKHGSTEQ